MSSNPSSRGTLCKAVHMIVRRLRETLNPPFEGHTGCIANTIALSPNGAHVFSGATDCTIRIWDAKSQDGMSGSSEEQHYDFSSVAFSPDGGRLSFGFRDGTICIRDFQSGNIMTLQIAQNAPGMHKVGTLSLSLSGGILHGSVL
jgi:WD40 repeat protein